MQHMTDAEYNVYKQRVLMKCGGSNVHKINGLLGRVGRIVSALQKGIIQSLKDIETQTALYQETIREIGALTSIYP